MHNNPRRTPALAMIAATAAAALLAGCTPPRAPDAPKAQRVTTYDCNRGPALVMHWPAQAGGPALMETGGRTIALQPERVASGFGYGQEGGGVYVRGQGHTMFVQAPRQVRANCVAR